MPTILPHPEPNYSGDPLRVTFVVGDGWPTPNNCRRVADALDAITPARYGDILRAYADAEDARVETTQSAEDELVARTRRRSTAAAEAHQRRLGRPLSSPPKDGGVA